MNKESDINVGLYYIIEREYGSIIWIEILGERHLTYRVSHILMDIRHSIINIITISTI